MTKIISFIIDNFLKKFRLRLIYKFYKEFYHNAIEFLVIIIYIFFKHIIMLVKTRVIIFNIILSNITSIIIINIFVYNYNIFGDANNN